MDNKLKHLEFIHNTINRMSTNSFIIKGWAVTLTSALFALSAKDSDRFYILITYIAIPVFWYLNAFFLLQERLYRSLYDIVRIKDELDVDFSMDTKPFKNGKNTLLECLFSNSIWQLYTLMLLVVLIVLLKS